ncbi:MAG: hypothetical protein IJO87_08770 [Eggerthellaceae bacterium]|nr:hypothetical protein [Eggerthellaceae bacterium]
MTEYKGYTGKILMVDLTTKEQTILNTFDYAPDYLGGVGLCAKIHWDMVGPDTELFSPDNVISFMTSPSMGAPVPGGQKTCVGGIAPHLYPKPSFMKSEYARLGLTAIAEELESKYGIKLPE